MAIAFAARHSPGRFCHGPQLQLIAVSMNLPSAFENLQAIFFHGFCHHTP